MEWTRESLKGSLTFIPIERGGAVGVDGDDLPVELTEVLRATSGMYDTAGYVPPWISYIAMHEGHPVGTCAFKSVPGEGLVEIAYFTFPAFEGRGIATEMASELIALVNRTGPELTIAAHTLPDRNASHRVLEKLGFTCIGTVQHPEDGPVLQWQKVANRDA